MPVSVRHLKITTVRAILVIVLSLVALSTALATPRSDDGTLFESRIRPLFAERCYSCHGNALVKGGLRLDSRAALMQGGGRGAAIVPGDPDRSLLLQAVRYKGGLKMPPSGPLSPAEIEALATWVKQGAIWPEDQVTPKPGAPQRGKSLPAVDAAAARHWSFLPVKRPAIPSVRSASWVKTPVDAFVLSALEAKGLSPALAANRRTLIRRATFDLTGLPPTPAEVDAFVADRFPTAWAKVVDRLLASPRYGERWGRHWLDVARYADSLDARGIGGEGDISEAWRYRDWVIDAFNRDMPYTDFVMNQIAGDLLPPPRQTGIRTTSENSAKDINVPGTIATGLLAIGNWGNGDADKDKILTDIADDQVDIVSRGFMGLTIGCARCHDHKFDPISTKDYYGLAGIFFSTHILPKLTPKGAGETPLRIPLETGADRDRRGQYAVKLAAMEKAAQAYRSEQLRSNAHSMLPQTERYLMAAWDYSHRPASESKLSSDEFAAKAGLKGYALRQWQDYLSLNEYRLMALPFDKLQGVEGVYGYNAPMGTPSLTANTNNEAKMILTFTLPPRSVCVHPGPTNGVAIGWKSPISGMVEISGRVVDADPACGNGIAWMLDHRSLRGPESIATGAFENGANQEFALGKGGGQLTHVSVKEGESIELLVLPKGEYSCDTTVVELTIKERGGSRIWNLANDILTDLHKGNPHADRYGHPDTWRFYDMATSRRGSGDATTTDVPLAAWHETVTKAEAGASDPSAMRAQIENAAQAFQAKFTLDDNRSPFWINRPDDEVVLPAAIREQMKRQAVELAEFRKNAPPPVIYANGAQDGGCPESPHAGVHDVKVHIRGNYARLGDLVPRHFPVVLAGEQQPPITQGSGRLELARWIASDTHPLTARVMVNRIWQHHFGQGIVRTPSNFGKLGERPTNQPLLDFLASEFVRSGWSMKQMHRLIMLSATYQQSSVAPPKTLRADPDNKLFGRMNRTRLEAEALRDNLLSVSGQLDTIMGGPAYRDFKIPRRTVYLVTIRSDRSGFGPLFDAADSTATMDHRTNSNVAPQALFLLNNPFALAQTRVIAGRLIASAPDDPGRIAFAYRLLYGRLPSVAETKIGMGFLSRFANRPQEKAPAVPNQSSGTRAWEVYSQILICANEFLYID